MGEDLQVWVMSQNGKGIKDTDCGCRMPSPLPMPDQIFLNQFLDFLGGEIPPLKSATMEPLHFTLSKFSYKE